MYDEFDMFMESVSGKFHGKALVEYNISRIKSLFKYDDKSGTIIVQNVKYPCTFDLFTPTCAIINAKTKDYKVNFGLDILCKQMTDANIKFIMLHEISHLRKDFNVHDEFELSIEWIRSELEMQGYYGKELELAMNKIIKKIQDELDKDNRKYSELSKLRDKCIKYIRKYENKYSSHSSAIEFEADREAANKIASQKDAVHALKHLYDNDNIILAVNEIRLETTYKNTISKYEEKKNKILNDKNLKSEEKQKKLEALQSGHEEFLSWYKRMISDKAFANKFFKMEKKYLRKQELVNYKKARQSLYEYINKMRDQMYEKYVNNVREIYRKNASHYQKNIMIKHAQQEYYLNLYQLQNYREEQLRLIDTKYTIGLDGLGNKISNKIDFAVGSRADKNSRLKAINDRWFANNATYLK